jgi:SAM-dependent methyltransferase
MSGQLASDFWDREVVEHRLVSWLEHQSVRFYVNELISGSIHQWPFDWFVATLDGRRFRRALSVGCGTGHVERHLVRRGVCERVDAFDSSIGSIAIARAEAKSDGVADRIHYYLADFNEPVLPRRHYDLIVFHQSLHHVGKLEKLLSRALAALKPDGLVYLDEYVGPSRYEWTDELIAAQRKVYATIAARTSRELEYPVERYDPSEALRSSEILPQLHHGFDVLQYRPYGGALLAPIYPWIDWDRAEPGLAEQLIAAEKELALPPYYAIALATPKGGLRRLVARLRYFAEPKLRRLRLEVRRRVFRMQHAKF